MKQQKGLGNILFLMTLISPLLAFAAASSIGEVEIFGIGGVVRYSWVMWLFIPLGVLSFMIGLKLKKSGLKYKKNLIVAVICIFLLFIFGSYRFIFNDNFSYDTNRITALETKAKVELVDQNEIKMVTQTMNEYKISYSKIINDEASVVFEQQIQTNHLWENELSSKIKSLLPLGLAYEMTSFDYFVFYNVTADDYNLYPLDGEYECMFIAYDCELKRLVVIDEFKIILT